jgi:hypothetical protein
MQDTQPTIVTSADSPLTPPVEPNGAEPKRLTKDQLADRTRFKFREQELEIPEIGGSLVLKSLSVRERELLPDPEALGKIDDEGKRTEQALRDAGLVFSCIVSEPEVTPEEASEFLADWPAEAFDRVTKAYGELIGTEEEARTAREEFPDRD